MLMGNPKFVWKARVIEQAECIQTTGISHSTFAVKACTEASVNWAGGINTSIDKA